ncbi:MAG: nitronate monooxygenase [Bacteroidales bacterium]
MKVLNFNGMIPSIPIVQGGMGVGISLSGLASAVASEGGVGVISCAGLGLIYRELSTSFKEACILGLREEIKKARAKTNGILGVNIMVALTNYVDMVKESIASGIDIIFSGAGLPLDLPKYLTPNSKTRLVPIVSSDRAARIICQKWYTLYNYIPDAIVLEGPKAGGHLGYNIDQIDDEAYSLENVLPKVLAFVEDFEKQHGKSIQIIAAGGIYTGEDIFKIMELGASGVQMGTRFVTTSECDASPLFKQTYLDSQQKDINIIKSPVGMPGRAIIGNFLEEVKAGLKRPKVCPFHCIKTCDITTSPYCIMSALYQAFKGNFNLGYAFAGSNAYRAHNITSVKETIGLLMAEYKEKVHEKLLNKLAK